jgi:hypothetical protein
MNFELLGNAAPHLHCHIKPRSSGAPAGGIPPSGPTPYAYWARCSWSGTSSGRRNTATWR